MGQGISYEELQLAARNHGLPLEALRWDVTPVGLHYLLTHYDIPEVDRGDLAARGRRARRAPALALPRRPPRAACDRARGDDGVRGQRPRARGAARRQPALGARGSGHRPLARNTARAAARGGRRAGGSRGGPLHRSRPRRRGRGGAGLRTQPPGRGSPHRRRAARVRDQRRAAAAATRLPAPARRPGLVRDGERQVAQADLAARRAVRRVPDAPLVSPPPGGGRGRRAALAHPGALAGRAAGDSGLPDPSAGGRGGRVRAPGPRVVRRGRSDRGRGLVRRRRDVGRAPSSGLRSSDALPGARGRSPGTRSRESGSSAAAPATRPGTSSRSSRPGTSAGTRTTRCSGSRSRSSPRAEPSLLPIVSA